MYRVWFSDLEKAIKVFREKVHDPLFASIRGNIYGDFIFQLDDDTTYLVNHFNFTIWQNCGDWRNPDWQEVK